MKQIVIITNRDQLGSVIQAGAANLAFKGALPSDIVVRVEEPAVAEVQAEAAPFKVVRDKAAVVVIPWMGSCEDPFIKKKSSELKAAETPFLVTTTQVEPLLFGGMEETAAITVNEYLTYGGMDNIENLLLWLGQEFGVLTGNVGEPAALPWNGIYHPDETSPLSLLEYCERYRRPDWPTVGILFMRDAWVWRNLEAYDLLIEALDRRQMNVIAAFSHWTRDDAQQIPGSEDTINQYFVQDGKPVVDAVITLMHYSLTVGRPLRNPKFLSALNVPLIHGDTLLQSPQEWRESPAGMNPAELIGNIVMPEFDGVIHGVPFAGRKKDRISGVVEYLAIPDRIETLAGRAAKWASLRRKPNREKKVAIIFHNYPPADFSIGTAIGLDSPVSVQRLMRRMAEVGYEMGDLPTDEYWLIRELTRQVTNDRSFLTEDKAAACTTRLQGRQYQEWYRSLPEKVRRQLQRDWGEAPGSVFRYGEDLLVPGVLFGNVFVSVQPPRGFGEDPGKIYHSSELAPTHHYLAYYHWIRDVFQADAVIHVGTHGSLEWLPGKSTGLSEECYPAIAISDLPNIYPYLITIICEGIQAKRRGAACIIGHLPAPVSNADTYDEMAELENLIGDYYHYKANQPEHLAIAEKLVRDKLADSTLVSDVPYKEGEAFEEYLERLHGYINEIKDSNVRVGLHILGDAPAGERLEEYLLAMTRVENGDTPSLRRVTAELLGYDYDALCAERGKYLPEKKMTHAQILDQIREYCREAIGVLSGGNFASNAVDAVLALPWVSGENEEARRKLAVVCGYICGELFPNLAKTVQEIDNALRALDGEYVEPGPAGAPTSGMADVLPSGRNFYGVDPRGIPTQLAWEVGKKLGDEVLARFLEDEGRYPENIGMIFWSGNNMRTRGQCIAEFLYLMGVRPQWQKGSGRVDGLEVISLDELRRPRIDVTGRISGMFRDSMPPVIDLLDLAVEMVTELDEPLEMNYIRKHALAEQADLEQQGVDREEAREQSRFRLFCCQPGTYGAGVGEVLENKNWQTVDDIAKVYVTWGSFAYTRKRYGQYAPENFSKRLASLEATIKNEDNYETNMLDADDYNSFHGGMIAAVRSLRGQAPRSYCGDSSDTGQVKVRSLQEETKRLFRSQVFNPKFIEGMQKHGYKGAADLAGVVSRSFAWDATSAVMEDWMYEGLAEKYALDKKMQEWLKEVNPWALQRIAEKLLEAVQRGLWQADRSMVQDLQKLYLSIEGELEERSDA